MGCRNLLSGPSSNHRLETSVYKPLGYESNLVCPTKVLSPMRLSEGIPFKTCDNPQAHNRKLNRANRYENEMV